MNDPNGDMAVDESAISGGCREWHRATLTSYKLFSNDDPSGSLAEYDRVTRDFLDEVNVVSIPEQEWSDYAYRNIEFRWKNKTYRVQAWDKCSKHDSDCRRNRNASAGNGWDGFVLDVEARTAQRLFGIRNAEEKLLEEVSFRACGSFDDQAIARRFGMKNNR